MTKEHVSKRPFTWSGSTDGVTTTLCACVRLSTTDDGSRAAVVQARRSTHTRFPIRLIMRTMNGPSPFPQDPSVNLALTKSYLSLTRDLLHFAGLQQRYTDSFCVISSSRARIQQMKRQAILLPTAKM